MKDCKMVLRSLGRQISQNRVRPRTQTKVTVIITTYNHERFINEAVDSVLMQETNFDYDVVIIEDRSTDRTRDIVIEYQKAYPEKIRLVLPEVNKCDNSEFMKAILSSPSPYVAILDGDDYWTCRQKLQKQVDYLDQHPECALCFHDVRIIYDDGSQEPRNSNPSDQKEISTLEDLFEGCFITTCSTMFRQGVFGEFPSWYDNDKCADWSLFVLAAEHGMIGCINEVMAVYRLHPGGFWTGRGRTDQLESVIQFYENLCGYLPVQHTSKIKTQLARSCYDLALEHEQAGNFDAAQRWFLKCLSAEQDVRKIEWNLRVAGGSEAGLVFPPDDPDTVRIAIGKAATKTGFDIQLNQPHLKVKANHGYTIQFRARADRERSIAVGFAEAHEPWNGLGLYKRVELTGEWQSYEQEFVAAADESNARIHFDVGESDISVELGSVSLLSLSDGDSVEPDLFPKVSIELGAQAYAGRKARRV
jgi:Glycosyl transferase family 2/Carbohydrate binding domain